MTGPVTTSNAIAYVLGVLTPFAVLLVVAIVKAARKDRATFSELAKGVGVVFIGLALVFLALYGLFTLIGKAFGI